MNPRFLVGAGLWSGGHTTLAIATAAQNQRIPQRIKDRQTERFR